MKGWVYVVTMSNTQGVVKIGYTDRDPDTRAAELSRDHSGAYRLANLNSGQSDAAGRTMHQQRFARLQIGALGERVRCRAIG